MTRNRQSLSPIFYLVSLSFLIFSYGCAKQGYSVIASTGTVIGVEISQNAATQVPQAKLGYNRAELAFVPSNRDGNIDAGNTHKGARDTANVIMELSYGGIFDTGPSSGIYQRLAVGDLAVTQPGASAMFLRNADGEYDENAKDALNAIMKIPAVSSDINAARAPLSSIFLDAYNNKHTDILEKCNNAAKEIGYPKTKNSYPDYSAFRDFAIYENVTLEEIQQIKNNLKLAGINF